MASAGKKVEMAAKSHTAGSEQPEKLQLLLLVEGI
jgi:hypothetical protein